MTLQEKKDLWLTANEAYFNKKAVMSDAEFDALTADLEKRAPKWLAAQGTGAKVDKKTEVQLTHLMPSLTKFYPDKIEKRLAKESGVQIIMDKLDGAALQVEYNKGRPTKVVTRGDGVKGGDISFLIPHLNLPRIGVMAHHVLRCEAIMKTKVFAAKYADQAENARALVNGALNRKKPSPALKDIDIVALGVYGMKVGAGLGWGELEGFTVVKRSRESSKDLAEKLPKLLEQRRKDSEYDMDGLVGASVYAEFAYANADKPKWIYAFKVNESVEDATKAVVKRVIWQTSRKSLLVPKIEIEPVRLGGTTVTYATSHNAKWMVDKGIGPGAVVQIVRSGDVIPKIVGVTKKARPQMPEVAHEWRGVHLAAIAKDKDATVREIHHFFKTMGMEFIAAKTIAKLYDSGFTSVVDHLAAFNDTTVLKGAYEIPGFKASATATSGMFRYHDAGIGLGMAAKIFAEYDRVFASGVLLRDLMVASNKMEAGIGERKLKAIEAHYKDEPNVLAVMVKNPFCVQLERLGQVPGFSDKSVALLIEGLDEFRPWLKEVLKYVKVRKPEAVKVVVRKGKLLGERVSFTGYRDEAQEKWITDNGGEVISYGSKTTILLYSPTGKKSAKVAAASGKGVRVLLFKDLK